jgi:hypothetical protein|nr:MAG TPA: hypothetical protein [Caudoviricetes sp.]
MNWEELLIKKEQLENSAVFLQSAGKTTEEAKKGFSEWARILKYLDNKKE